MTDETPRALSRRSMLRLTAGTAAAGLAGRAGGDTLATPARPTAASSMIGVPFEKREPVRFALVGCGGRGRSLLRNMLRVEGVEVKAVCDIVPEKVERMQTMVENAAAWCAPGPLSELSVAQRSTSVSFPDFTRGGWSQARS